MASEDNRQYCYECKHSTAIYFNEMRCTQARNLVSGKPKK